jgi:hypothetical protein
VTVRRLCLHGVMANWEIVQCSGGAFYETKWIPLASFKAIRLGPKRFQRCPVHQKWEMTSRVPDSALTPQIREQAAEHRDSGMI